MLISPIRDDEGVLELFAFSIELNKLINTLAGEEKM